QNVLLCPPNSALARAAVGAEVIGLPMSGDLDLRLIARLVRMLKALRPDLLHVHSRRGADLFGGWAARLSGVPAVLTRRVDSAEPAMVARVKCRPYRALIAISARIEEQLLSSGLGRARIHRVPSAVDIERFRPS